jgi:hypothetical protein
MACFDVAAALGYCDPPAEVSTTLRRTISALVSLAGLRNP